MRWNLVIEPSTFFLLLLQHVRLISEIGRFRLITFRQQGATRHTKMHACAHVHVYLQIDVYIHMYMYR